MEGYCSTGQSPQRAVVPVEEEEEKEEEEEAVIPFLWSGLTKISEPEILGCRRLLKHATDIYKNVSEVMYGFRILNNASDADNTPLMG
jgi:hypothetical protein